MTQENIKTLQDSILTGQQEISNQIMQAINILSDLKAAKNIEEESKLVNSLDDLIKKAIINKEQTEMAMKLYSGINDPAIKCILQPAQVIFELSIQCANEFISTYSDAINKFKTDIALRMMRGEK